MTAQASEMSNKRIKAHRGSIIWALVLIAVGALFLYHNFNPDFHVWYLIARFWPVLIILWGISKLLDYLEIRAHPEVPGRRMFSAGEVVLLVLVLVFGWLFSTAVLRHGNGWAWSVHTTHHHVRLYPDSYTLLRNHTNIPAPNPIATGRR